MVLRSAAVFLGDMAMFQRVFVKHRVSESERGSMFVCVPAVAESEALAQTAERCKHRGLLLDSEITWRSTLGAGDRLRLQGYEAGGRCTIEQAIAVLVADAGTEAVDDTAIELMRMQLQGPGLVTLRQTYGEKGACAFQHHVPVLLAGSRLYSLRRDRLLLGGEHLMIQGGSNLVE